MNVSVEALPGYKEKIPTDKPIFSNWASLDKKVIRSSAPYYVSDDRDQKITVQVVDFLLHKNINQIISLNH